MRFFKDRSSLSSFPERLNDFFSSKISIKYCSHNTFVFGKLPSQLSSVTSLIFRYVSDCLSPLGPSKISGSRDKFIYSIVLPVLILDRVKSIIETTTPCVLMDIVFPSRVNGNVVVSFLLKRMFPQCRSRCSNSNAASATAKAAVT
uniref:Uncharacterized protein n=1 Tax=Opuntia streptacantha TaxID=393608 RepID=A0A7C8ZH06_OPUST